MRFALALFLLITATRANDEYVEERFIDAASFGGTVYIAISPGSINVSVFFILLHPLVNMLICSLYTSWKRLNVLYAK